MKMELAEGFKDTEIGRIPKEWKVAKLGNISEFRRGFSYRSDQITKVATKIRFITINDLEKEGGLKKTAEKIYLKEEVDIDLAFFLNEGDVLIANTDMSKGFIIGAPLLVENTGGEKLVYSMDLTKLVFNNSEVYNRYLFYILKHDLIRRKMKTFAQGTNVLHLNHDLVKFLKIPLPPLPEQRKIAEILSTVDEAIQKVDEAIRRTERLKRGLMQELLTKGIGHKEFKDTEIGRIPKDWEVVRLRDVADYINGYAFSPRDWKSEGLPIIRIQNLNDPNAEFNYFDGEIDDRYIIENGDLLFSWSASIGAYIWNRGRAVLNQHIFKVVPKENVEKLFLYYALFLAIDQLRSRVHGSTMKHFKRGELKTLIPLPPLPEQRKIAEILSTVDKKLDLERKRREKLERIKQGLMNDLLTGKRRVKM
jgi:type I restriction enzyme S subunit